MKGIYEPHGRAAEYCGLAVNLYIGCSHGCLYCYAPAVLRRERQDFHTQVQPRQGIIEAIRADKRQPKPGEQVLLCFTCDPYQPTEASAGVTRAAIEELHQKGFGVRILTKGGKLAQRDFDLLGPGDAFGQTLTFVAESGGSSYWEPGAARPEERMANLEEAHKLGLPTWVSLEPVLSPEEAMDIILMTHEYVDEYKVGIWNYDLHADDIDWARFGREAEALLRDLGCKYYLKRDLRERMGQE